MASAASMRTSLRLSSARRLETSTHGLEAERGAGDEREVLGDRVVLADRPAPLPRSPAHSRAIFSAYFVVAAQIAGSDRRPGVQRRQRDLQALALARR